MGASAALVAALSTMNEACGQINESCSGVFRQEPSSGWAVFRVASLRSVRGIFRRWWWCCCMRASLGKKESHE